jgi:hypothetical protein
MRALAMVRADPKARFWPVVLGTITDPRPLLEIPGVAEQFRLFDHWLLRLDPQNIARMDERYPPLVTPLFAAVREAAPTIDHDGDGRAVVVIEV